MAFRGDRLRARRKNLRLSQAELADMVGLSQRSVSDLESGKTMKTDKLRELADVCGVSPDWLLGLEEGDDDMRAARMLRSVSDIGKMTKSELLEQKFIGPLRAAKIEAMLQVREIDVRGGASYGGGIIDESHQEDGNPSDKVVARWGLPTEFVESELGLRSGGMDIIKVRGDSMDDGSAKGLSSGDRVMVDRDDRDVRQGGIFVVFDGVGIIIKQVELDREAQPPRIVCKSLNTRYSPITLTLESPVQVVGRVAARISRM
ncbi:helix-turn-helix domain-containing protein [Methylobacterium sp. WL7]|uniref:XRE family transcriptional regulator n=1 Tax=Methylobacterium sp. WL7 TaxID=2603900 RepID=UPI0011CC3E7F|nr:helix-turn-helix domain-containing protein [Methylobacterium sp. WL7]TXN40517.1 helix-turn-helix domain-containing protein [Methylobacterium sp. WL7]